MLRQLLFVGACVVVGAGCSSSTVVKGSGGASGSAGVGGHGTGGSGGVGTGGSGGGTQCVPDAGCSGAGCVQTLYSGESAPGPLYVDISKAYWVAGTTKLSLRAGPKAGGCAATTVVSDLAITGKVKSMIGDTTTIYLGTTDPAKAVVKVDKASGTSMVLVGKSQCSSGGNGLIAANDSHIVFDCNDGNGQVERILKTGSASPDIVFAPTTGEVYYGVAADNVYSYNDTGAIGRQRLDGSSGGSLYSSAQAINGMVLGDQLYWFKGKGLAQGAIDGSSATIRYSGLVQPGVLAADDQGAYMGDLGGGDGNGSILAALTGHGGAAVIADKQNHPTAIAVDSLYIYWTDQNGTVRRGGRP